MAPDLDAVIVGTGPNGLAAAITLARAGRAVLAVEAAPTIGGGTRSIGLTLPGFVHDVCAAILPLVVGSPFFRALPLATHGLVMIEPSAPLAHPLDDGPAVLLERSVDRTAAGLGRDAGAYRSLVAPLVEHWSQLADALLGPLRLLATSLPLLGFATVALRSAAAVARSRFATEPARALFAGLAGHSMLPLGQAPSAAFALVLGVLGHVVGWPLARGGTRGVSDALAAHLASLGGRIETGRRVDRMADLPPARAALLDLTPREVVRVAGDLMPAGYRARLERYRWGPGVFKIDWALDGPIPWRAPECARAATVHLGGALDEIERAEAEVALGAHPERPFVILAQPSLFDPTRAPEGRHTGWAYCHVPNGSTIDMTEPIERQVERFAPGFRERILARHTITARGLELYNANYVGGDINGGRQDLTQLFTRPVVSWSPYTTPVPGLYLCSSATPPGGGVHGMCGYWAARAALGRADDLRTVYSARGGSRGRS